jgi:hypothetical protein
MARLLGGTMLAMGVCAEECESSAILQRINRNAVSASVPTQQLLQAATKMLREGSTPAVITFTQDTFKEIQDDIFPKILANHKKDQEMLDAQLAELEAIVADYQKELKTLAENNRVEEAAASTHVRCRGTQSTKELSLSPTELSLCRDASNKNWIRATKWKILINAERVYEGHAETLHGRFCPPGAATWHSKNLHEDEINPMVTGLVEYRRITKDVMMKFNVKGDYYFRTTIVEWMEADTIAQKANDTHLVKRTECNNYKKILEEKSCIRAQHHAQIIATFEEEFTAAELILNKTKENVAISEADRIREFVTLNMVQCLLKKIEEKNGTKCDESTDEADTIIKNCETSTVVTIHLEIDYPCSPDRPNHDPIKCYPGTPVCYREERYKVIEEFGFCFSDHEEDKVHNNFPMPAIHNKDCKIIDVSKHLGEETKETKDTVGNNGHAFCSAYCSRNWNHEMPSHWKGACCLKAFDHAGQEISCTEQVLKPVTCRCRRSDNTPWLIGSDFTDTRYSCQ